MCENEINQSGIRTGELQVEFSTQLWAGESGILPLKILIFFGFSLDLQS